MTIDDDYDPDHYLCFDDSDDDDNDDGDDY